MIRRERSPFQHAGMSLVEILIALVVFIIAGGGLMVAHLYGSQLSEQAMATVKAVNDLDDIMECIRATPFDTVTAAFPDGLPNGGGAGDYSAMVGGYTLVGEQITVRYPLQTPERLEILVTVNWTQRGRARSTSLSTLKTKG